MTRDHGLRPLPEEQADDGGFGSGAPLLFLHPWLTCGARLAPASCILALRRQRRRMPSQVSTATSMHDQGVRRAWLLSLAHRGGRPPKHDLPLEQCWTGAACLLFCVSGELLLFLLPTERRD
jgi:hypothetical protein